MSEETISVNDHYIAVPIEDLVSPQHSGIYRLLKDHWWIVRADGALFYRFGKRSFGSPQCNSDERLVRMLAARLDFPVEICFLPFALVPMEKEDF